MVFGWLMNWKNRGKLIQNQMKMQNSNLEEYEGLI